MRNQDTDRLHDAIGWTLVVIASLAFATAVHAIYRFAIT